MAKTPIAGHVGNAHLRITRQMDAVDGQEREDTRPLFVTLIAAEQLSNVAQRSKSARISNHATISFLLDGASALLLSVRRAASLRAATGYWMGGQGSASLPGYEMVSARSVEVPVEQWARRGRAALFTFGWWFHGVEIEVPLFRFVPPGQMPDKSAIHEWVLRQHPDRMERVPVAMFTYRPGASRALLLALGVD
jgi:hypothetical protein